MILVDGERWCSGSLLNTTSPNDNFPLLLTANHCLSKGEDAVTNFQPMLSYWSFMWHYESPTCANAVPATITTTGAQLQANYYDSDFALVRLTTIPLNAPDIVPYYLGWDRSSSPMANGGVGIHHPVGDIKKISIANSYQNHPNQITWNYYTTSPKNTHWAVNYTNGTTSMLYSKFSGII